jgi:hypothetical protein
MKPAVAGTPASDSIAIVIGHASHGCVSPRFSSEEMSSPRSDTRSRAITTANAATFITR